MGVVRGGARQGRGRGGLARSPRPSGMRAGVRRCAPAARSLRSRSARGSRDGASFRRRTQDRPARGWSLRSPTASLRPAGSWFDAALHRRAVEPGPKAECERQDPSRRPPQRRTVWPAAADSGGSWILPGTSTKASSIMKKRPPAGIHPSGEIPRPGLSDACDPASARWRLPFRPLPEARTGEAV